MKIAQKYKLKYAIVGKSKVSFTNTANIEIVTHIIDIKKKKIIETLVTKNVITKNETNIATNWRKLHVTNFEKVLQNILPILSAL